MAQIQTGLLKMSASLKTVMMCRNLSVTASFAKDVKKFVFVSQSNDIYTNLALEKWLFQNNDFSDRHVLLISRNKPCVVIGENQNPWVESNIQQLKNISKDGVLLARREAHGPAIYQDEGTVNLTFFADKENSNCYHNIDTLRKALFRAFNLTTKIVHNKDIILRNRKVSDTTTLVGEQVAYQQCSLLVHVNKSDSLEALKTESPFKPKDNVKYINLVDENYRVTIEKLISAVGWEYMRTTTPSLVGGFHMIKPTDEWFPGLRDIRNRLANWDWIFGKTPRFTLNRSFSIPRHLTENADGLYPEINITMVVENARIADVTMFVPRDFSKNGFSNEETKIFTNLKGRKFTEDAVKFLEDYVKDAVYANDKDRFVSDCVKQVMTSV